MYVYHYIMPISIPSASVLKWVAAGAVAAIVATVGFFDKFGDPLIQGLIMIIIGVVILMLVDTKKLGVFVGIPAGFIIAGAVVLSNKFIVPLLKEGIID